MHSTKANIEIWEGFLEVTSVSRYRCTVKASSRTEAHKKLESSMDETETTYPCGCGCNRRSSEVRKAHSVRLVTKSQDTKWRDVQ